MDFERPTIPCLRCGQPIDEAQAAEDYDAGVESWDLCERCAAQDDTADDVGSADAANGLPS